MAAFSDAFLAPFLSLSLYVFSFSLTFLVPSSPFCALFLPLSSTSSLSSGNFLESVSPSLLWSFAVFFISSSISSSVLPLLSFLAFRKLNQPLSFCQDLSRKDAKRPLKPRRKACRTSGFLVKIFLISLEEFFISIFFPSLM